MDMLGPFPLSDRGNRYVLVAMDYFTKWAEVYAIPDQSATATANVLVEGSCTSIRGGTLRQSYKTQDEENEPHIPSSSERRAGGAVQSDSGNSAHSAHQQPTT